MALSLESKEPIARTNSASQSEQESGEPTGYMYMNVGEVGDAQRCWEDCQRYGFLMAGHGDRFVREIQKLQPGDEVFVYLNQCGYVGFGRVTSAAVKQSEFVVQSLGKRLIDLPLLVEPDRASLGHPIEGDWCVGVEWFVTLDRDEAIHQEHVIPHMTVCRMHNPTVVTNLLRGFIIHPKN